MCGSHLHDIPCARHSGAAAPCSISAFHGPIEARIHARRDGRASLRNLIGACWPVKHRTRCKPSGRGSDKPCSSRKHAWRRSASAKTGPHRRAEGRQHRLHLQCASCLWDTHEFFVLRRRSLLHQRRHRPSVRGRSGVRGVEAAEGRGLRGCQQAVRHNRAHRRKSSSLGAVPPKLAPKSSRSKGREVPRSVAQSRARDQRKEPRLPECEKLRASEPLNILERRRGPRSVATSRECECRIGRDHSISGYANNAPLKSNARHLGSWRLLGVPRVIVERSRHPLVVRRTAIVNHGRAVSWPRRPQRRVARRRCRRSRTARCRRRCARGSSRRAWSPCFSRRSRCRGRCVDSPPAASSARVQPRDLLKQTGDVAQ